MNEWVYLLIGVAIGWLLELLVDFFFFRNSRICDEAERTMQARITQLEEQNVKMTYDITQLRERADRATALKTELDGRNEAYDSLMAAYRSREEELASVNTSLQMKDDEVGNLRSLEAQITSMQSQLDAKDQLIAELQAGQSDLDTTAVGDTTAGVDGVDYSAELATRDARIAELEEEIHSLREDKEVTLEEQKPMTRDSADVPQFADRAAPSEPDDLKKIWGIGPKIESVLNGSGINTFVQLASTPADRLNDILQAAGTRFSLSSDQLHESWSRQATVAARGDWDGLEQLQNELNWSDLNKRS